MDKQKRYRNRKYLAAARDNPCTLNSPACNYDSATTVFCHLNESFAGKGMGKKADDFAGFDGCSGCHDLYDRRRYLEAHLQEEWQKDENFYVLRAMTKTIRDRIERGIIKTL